MLTDRARGKSSIVGEMLEIFFLINVIGSFGNNVRSQYDNI